MIDPIRSILTIPDADIPHNVIDQVKIALIDSFGITSAGRKTRLSAIIYDCAAEMYGGQIALPFPMQTPQHANAAGFALALGMTTDAIDGHDGFNLAKGHIGAPLYPALLGAALDPTLCPQPPSGQSFLAALAMGYEVGARTSIVQHATVPDYHTSGSWGAVTAAAAICRLANLPCEITRHAVGIAEYHGPRSQMMRVIDHPTMLKDGAGWGAMTGVLAVKLAMRGFTGAPAITIEEAPDTWADLGTRWYGLEQYYKPYPVCRWAQPCVEAALSAQRALNVRAEDIATIELETFHESLRLATVTPMTTDEAQYSTAFPVALALLHGTVGPEHLSDEAIQDPMARALAQKITIREHDFANEAFPARRFARVRLTTTDGHSHTSDWHEPKWDHTAPPSHHELIQKYRNITRSTIGITAAETLRDAVETLEMRGLSPLIRSLGAPML